MKADRPSFTAAWVAALRGLAPVLGPDAQLADDPWGTRFAGPTAQAIERLCARAPRLARTLARVPNLRRQLLWQQLRTRALDDEVRAFLAAGGRQVVLLGAGLDARATRLRPALGDALVVEVDHPATQAKKRRVLVEAGAQPGHTAYLAWDFERDQMAALPGALASAGLDPTRPALTLWEGVTMYLTEPAIDATVRAVRAFAAPGSRLALTYFERSMLERPRLATRVVAQVVARVGEPFKFGWDPAALPAWMDARGLRVVRDRDDAALARAYLPADEVRRYTGGGRHVALVETV